MADLNGEVKHLVENKDQLAINFLKEREPYILIKVDRVKTNEIKNVYSALFTSDKIVLDDYANKLNSIKKNKNLNSKVVVKNKQQPLQQQQQQPITGSLKKKQSMLLSQNVSIHSTIQSIDDNSPVPGEKE